MEDERIYIAVGQNTWGKGFSPLTAKVEATLVGGRFPFTVYKLPHGAYNVHVDMFGSVCWYGPDESLEKVENPKKDEDLPKTSVVGDFVIMVDGEIEAESLEEYQRKLEKYFEYLERLNDRFYDNSGCCLDFVLVDEKVE